jgi:hypothetical protein
MDSISLVSDPVAFSEHSKRKMRKLIILPLAAFLTINFAFSQTSRTDGDKINSLPFIKPSDDVKLFGKIAGNGPVCIFVQGGPAAWSKSFEDMKSNSLERKLRMVYYDQRGSGRSGISGEKKWVCENRKLLVSSLLMSGPTEKDYTVTTTSRPR